MICQGRFNFFSLAAIILLHLIYYNLLADPIRSINLVALKPQGALAFSIELYVLNDAVL